MSRISSWFLSGVLDRLDAFEHMLGAIQRTLEQVVQGQVKEMAAIDDLTTAVDGAVTEMEHAVTTIQNHPGASQDPQLSALATRLNNAVAALKLVDPAEAVAQASGDGTTAQPGA